MERAVTRAYAGLRERAPTDPAIARRAGEAKSTEDAIRALQSAVAALSQSHLAHAYSAYAALNERFRAVARTLASVADEESEEGARAANTLELQQSVHDNNALLEERLNACKEVRLLTSTTAVDMYVLCRGCRFPLSGCA
jgi:dihydroxyacetone kinase-like predicted kinase